MMSTYPASTRRFGKDTGRERPVPDGANHILSDAEFDHGIITVKRSSIRYDGIDRFC